MIIEITDHVDRAKALLPEQFNNKPNIENLITLFGDKVQELETVFFQLLNERSLDTSVGQQLDNLGEILGETRNGRNDADYRSALGVRIKINVSSGVPETIIDVMAALTNATSVLYRELYPAEIHLASNGDTIPSDLLANMKRVMPAGVGISLTTYGAVTNPFTFNTPGSGFGDGEFVFGA